MQRKMARLERMRFLIAVVGGSVLVVLLITVFVWAAAAGPRTE